MIVKFNHTLHKELWNFLANNPEMEKEDWDGWRRHRWVESGCFACDYVETQAIVLKCIKEHRYRCFYCPLEWVDEDGNECATCLEAEVFSCYDAWDHAKCDLSKRSMWAEVIRDLKVKKGVICE